MPNRIRIYVGGLAVLAVLVFVAVSVRSGRDNKVLTGSVEMRESQESAGVLAVLDATNRWIEHN